MLLPATGRMQTCFPSALRQCESPDDWTRFTPAEQRTMMSLWCMMRSPLMIGGEMTKNDDFTLSLLTNRNILEILQSSWCVHPLRTTEEESVWIAPRQDGDGFYLALFNLSDRKRTVSASPTLPEGKKAEITELWSSRRLRCSDSLRVALAPHDAAVCRVRII